MSHLHDARGDAHFARVRVALGVFLFVHFLHLLPWAPELFSNIGMLADGSASPLLHLFANPLALFDGPLFAQCFVASGALASLVLVFGNGPRKRIAALYLWFVLACLFGRNPLIRNPSLPYLGVLLLVYAASPKRPDVSLLRVVWVLLALGYAYSGITKLTSPSWLDGSAITAILNNPLARPGVAHDFLLALPSGFLVAASFGTLFLEISFPLLALSKRTRPLAWLAMTALQLSLLVLVDFADVTWGMLLVHAFTFDPRWLKRLLSSSSANPDHCHDGPHGRGRLYGAVRRNSHGVHPSGAHWAMACHTLFSRWRKHQT
ncbi:MAG: hypothetical protein ACI9KE_003133 [Polyangiales bacterium]|jgi:hypothetical protein